MKYFGLLLLILLFTGCYDSGFRLYQATVSSDLSKGKDIKKLVVKSSNNKVLNISPAHYNDIISSTFSYSSIERITHSNRDKMDLEDTLIVTSNDGSIWEIPFVKDTLLFGNFRCVVQNDIDSLIEVFQKRIDANESQ